LAHTVISYYCLNLNSIIRASNAIEGNGVADGINWLSEIIKRNKK